MPETTPDGPREMLGRIERERGGLDGFAVAAGGYPDEDPTAYEMVGAPWWLTQLPESSTTNDVAAFLERHRRSA